LSPSKSFYASQILDRAEYIAICTPHGATLIALIMEGAFIWAPLRIIGATGSPGNPIVLY
jgi:hypothetical protein